MTRMFIFFDCKIFQVLDKWQAFSIDRSECFYHPNQSICSDKSSEEIQVIRLKSSEENGDFLRNKASSSIHFRPRIASQKSIRTDRKMAWHFKHSLCPGNARDLGLFPKILAFRYAANSMKCGFGGCEFAIGTVVAALFANLHILRSYVVWSFSNRGGVCPLDRLYGRGGSNCYVTI